MSDPRRRGAPIDWTRVRERLARAGEALRSGARPSQADAVAILDARARALAEAPEAPRAGADIGVIAFELGGERYALVASLVREILRLPRIAPVPGAPPFLSGIANVQGDVLDVLDVRAFLGAAPAPATERARVLVLGGDRPELALRCDGVNGFERADTSALAAPPEAPGRIRPEYVRGLLPDGTALLDGEAILRDPRLVVDDAPPLHRPEVT